MLKDKKMFSHKFEISKEQLIILFSSELLSDWVEFILIRANNIISHVLVMEEDKKKEESKTEASKKKVTISRSSSMYI